MVSRAGWDMLGSSVPVEYQENTEGWKADESELKKWQATMVDCVLDDRLVETFSISLYLVAMKIHDVSTYSVLVMNFLLQ